MSEHHTICRDCGINAWSFTADGRRVHEDFYVHDGLWDAVCPDDGVEGTYVLCIGCFERRLGRRLTREDLKHGANVARAPWPGRGTPPSSRFVDRSGTSAQLVLFDPAKGAAA